MGIPKTSPIDILTALNVDEGTWTQAGMEFDSINWVNDVKTTKTEWDKKRVELEVEFDAQEYARNRASATGYPSIPDQLDEIYHNGIDSWKAIIKVTKDKYPKG